MEQPSRGKRRRQQPARPGGQRPASGARPGFDRTQAGKHDDPFGAGKQLRGAGHVVGMRRNRRRARQQFARGPGQIRRSVPGPVLQIERNTDHHGPTFAARLQECVAYRNRHALGHVQAVIGGTRRGDERRLVDLLVVPAAFQRRFAGEHHQRQMGTHRRRERRDQLRHTGPARDGRHAHVPVLSRVRHGGSERAVLVPDIDHAASLLGQPRGPIHVRIPEERETRSHVLLYEGLGKDVVHTGLGFILHRCNPRIERSQYRALASRKTGATAALFRSDSNTAVALTSGRVICHFGLRVGIRQSLSIMQ